MQRFLAGGFGLLFGGWILLELVQGLSSGRNVFYWEGFAGLLFGLFFAYFGFMMMTGQEPPWNREKVAGIRVAGTGAEDYGAGRIVGAALLVIGALLLIGIAREFLGGSDHPGLLVLGVMAGLVLVYVGWLGVSRGWHLWWPSPALEGGMRTARLWAIRLASVLAVMGGGLLLVIAAHNAWARGAGIFSGVVGAILVALGGMGLRKTKEL